MQITRNNLDTNPHVAIQQAGDSGHVVGWGRHVSDDEYAQVPSLEGGDR